jgi:maleamate amidohydrolase
MSGSRLMGGDGGFGSSPALVIVDVTVAFTDAASPLCCDDGTAVAANVRLLDAARAAGVPVAFSAVVVGEPERQAAAHFLRKMPGLLSIADDPERVKIDPRIAPREGEPVIEKIFPSVFFGTALASILAAWRIDTVVVTGMSTSGCVRATAVDALQYGFRPIVAREAVADRDQVAHDNALRDLQLKYADVVGVDAVLDHFRRMTQDKTIDLDGAAS